LAVTITPALSPHRPPPPWRRRLALFAGGLAIGCVVLGLVVQMRMKSAADAKAREAQEQTTADERKSQRIKDLYPDPSASPSPSQTNP